MKNIAIIVSFVLFTVYTANASANDDIWKVILGIGVVSVLLDNDQEYEHNYHDRRYHHRHEPHRVIIVPKRRYYYRDHHHSHRHKYYDERDPYSLHRRR